MGPGWGATLAAIPTPASTVAVYERHENGSDVEQPYWVHANAESNWCSTGTNHVVYPRKREWHSAYGAKNWDGPHSGGSTMAFCDGHAKWYRYDQTKIGGGANASGDCNGDATASIFDRRYPM